MNPTEARRRIAAIRADTAHPFFAESHPGHTRAVRDVESLYAQAYPEPPVENPLDRPVPVKAPPPADPGLKHRESGVFWQQSAPIPREDMEAAHAAEAESRQAGQESMKKFAREYGQAQHDVAVAKGQTYRSIGRGVADAASGFGKWYIEITDDERRGQYALDVSRMPPDQLLVYQGQVLQRMQEIGVRDADKMTPDMVPVPRVNPESPRYFMPGFLLSPKTGRLMRIWPDEVKNPAEVISGPGRLDGVRDELKDQQMRR